MKQGNMYFITGASGVGKTSIFQHVKSLLPKNFEIHDFDERGVPDNADHTWRIEETKYWIHLANEKVGENKTILILGFANPDEIKLIQPDFPNIVIKTILLDGEVAVIEKRLRNRNKDKKVLADLERATGSAEKFIKNNSNFIPTLREICLKHRCHIIDTTHLKPEAVAIRVAQLVT